MSYIKAKCMKFDFGWGSTPYPAGEAYNAPQTPYLVGKGWPPAPQATTPAVGPSGLESLHEICSVDSHENNYN